MLYTNEPISVRHHRIARAESWLQSSIDFAVNCRNLGVTKRFFLSNHGRSSPMHKPNTDPLLQPPLRKRKRSADQTNETREGTDIRKAADTLFKGTPPPNAKSGQCETEREGRE
jgi:hypothetical protein